MFILTPTYLYKKIFLHLHLVLHIYVCVKCEMVA